MEGNCLCRAIRLRVPSPTEKPPILTFLCHCRDCQRNAGGAYQTMAIYNKDDVTIVDLDSNAGKSQARLTFYSDEEQVLMWFLGRRLPVVNQNPKSFVETADAHCIQYRPNGMARRLWFEAVYWIWLLSKRKPWNRKRNGLWKVDSNGVYLFLGPSKCKVADW
jgi:hypothetical protein